MATSPRLAALSGKQTQNTDLVPGINVGNLLSQAGSYVGLAPKGDYDIFDNLTVSDREGQTVANPFQSTFGTPAVKGAYTTTPYNPYFPNATVSGIDESVLGSSDTNNSGYSNSYTAEDVAYLEDQASQFRDLLNRLGTTREQGQKKIENEYGKQVDLSNTDKQNQYAQYAQQRAGQLSDKATNYSAINQAGNKGYRSLADILGRASGTGSSVFQQLLPSIIGKDISAKRSAANTLYGKNMQNIQGSQNAYDVSFQRVLDDLAEQKRQNEESLLSGIEEQRQSLLPKLGTIEGQLASARGGGYAQVRAAQQPYADQLRASNDAVSGLFDKYFKAYTPSKAVAPAPELGTYTMDRSQINAANTNNAGVDPYAALLRKRLQENQ